MKRVTVTNSHLKKENGFLRNGMVNPIFEHQKTKEGVIDSLPSKLKEVYKRYLNIIQKGEMDIVQCGWSNYRMSEKSLIDFM